MGFDRLPGVRNAGMGEESGRLAGGQDDWPIAYVSPSNGYSSPTTSAGSYEPYSPNNKLGKLSFPPFTFPLSTSSTRLFSYEFRYRYDETSENYLYATDGTVL